MRHLRLAVLAVGALVGLGGVASAADIPLKALPPPVFVWTGWYGGANVGYSWGSSRSTTDIDSTIVAAYSADVPHRGWEASVEGGYCYQPGRDRDTNFVACIEARYDFPAERSSQVYIPNPTSTTITTTTHIDPILIGPHLGFTTSANRTFWYAAGGLAIGQVGGSSIGIDTVGDTSTANPATKWSTGWFIGAGAEQMLTNNWSVKVEYDYVNLGTGGSTDLYSGNNLLLDPDLRRNPTFSTATSTVASRPYDNVVTAGINYHLH